MAKVKVEVTGAYVDGKAPGTELNIEEKDADYLESIGYVRKVAKADAKPKATPKTKSEEKPKTKTEEKPKATKASTKDSK